MEEHPIPGQLLNADWDTYYADDGIYSGLGRITTKKRTNFTGMHTFLSKHHCPSYPMEIEDQDRYATALEEAVNTVDSFDISDMKASDNEWMSKCVANACEKAHEKVHLAGWKSKCEVIWEEEVEVETATGPSVGTKRAAAAVAPGFPDLDGVATEVAAVKRHVTTYVHDMKAEVEETKAELEEAKTELEEAKKKIQELEEVISKVRNTLKKS